MNKKLKTKELNRVEADTFRKMDKFPIVVVLDSLRSLHNVGSVFRSCDAFKIEKIVLCGLTACPPHRDIHKTALGATESVDWVYEAQVIDSVRELKKQGYTIIAAEQAQETILLQDLASHCGDRVAFIFGNEVFGVAQEVITLSDFVVEIPQFGTKHSLNVSVSVGIVLWEAIRGRI